MSQHRTYSPELKLKFAMNTIKDWDSFQAPPYPSGHEGSPPPAASALMPSRYNDALLDSTRQILVVMARIEKCKKTPW